MGTAMSDQLTRQLWQIHRLQLHAPRNLAL